MQGVLDGFNGAKITNYSTAIKGLSLNQAQLLLSTEGLNKAKQKEILIDAGLIASENKIQGELLQSILEQKGLNSVKQQEVLIELGLMDRKTKKLLIDKSCTKETLKAVLAQKLKNGEDAEGIIKALGLAGANTTTTASFGLLTKGIWANIKAMAAWMISNPLGWIILLGGTIAATVGLVDLFTTSVEEHREKLENLKSEYSDVKSELDGLKGELDGTQSRINELESKGKLTFTEAEELNNLRKQNNELQRSIDLLELQNKTKKKELNDQFVETMNSDIEQELYTRNENDEVVQYMPISGQTATDDNEADYINQRFKDLQKLRDELASASTEAEKERINRQIKGIEDYFIQKNKDFTETAEGIDYIQNPTTKDDEKVNEWLDYINDFQDKMAIAMGEGSAKENAFNRLVDNWKFDELLNPLQQLGKEGKVTLDELKKRMDDPVFVEFVNKLKDIGFISDTTDGSLRFLANTFNNTIPSAKEYLSTFDKIDSLSLDNEEAVNNFIESFQNEAKAIGTTTDELAKLTSEHLILNNTTLSLEDKEAALRALGETSAWAKSQVSELIALMNQAAGAYSVENPHDIRDGDRSGSAQLALHTLFGRWKKVDTDVDNDTPPYSPSGDDKGSSKDNTPDYEDPTDAIINRINLRAKELEQDEEAIQNKIELAEAENDYKKQISLTNDLIDSRKQRIDELSKANAGLHNEAEWLRNSNTFYNEDGTESDENLWFDSQGNATEYYHDLINKTGITKEEREAIENLFENLSKYKKAYAENAEEIVGLNKEILQSEQDIADTREESYNEALDEIQRYADRVTDYYDKINKGLDKQIQAKEAILQITQKQTDVTGNLMDAQTELDKSLRDAKLSTEYLTEEEREKIFNEDDYNKLSLIITTTQKDINTLTADFMQQIENAYANDQLYLVEAITAEYERQVDMKERELEVAKAQVDLTKKQLQLNNVLAEKNVKQLVERNGQYVWEWVANTDDVRRATEEVLDAEAKIKRAEYDKNQQLILNGQQSVIDGLNSQKGLNDYRVEVLNGYVDDISLAIENSVDPIKDFASISALLDGASGDVLSAFNKITSSILGTYSGAINTSKASSGGSGNSYSKNLDPDYVSWAKQQMDINSSKWHTASDSEKRALENANQSLGKAIGSTYDEVTGTWKHKYASGSKYTLAGDALMGEDGEEIFITKSGRLIPINQPTIGNIDAGGIVFNQDQMANLRSLWDMSNIGKFSMDGIVTDRASLLSQSASNDTIFSGDINVYSPHDYNDFVRALTQRMKQKNV